MASRAFVCTETALASACNAVECVCAGSVLRNQRNSPLAILQGSQPIGGVSTWMRNV